MASEMFLRLWTRAPRMKMDSSKGFWGSGGNPLAKLIIPDWSSRVRKIGGYGERTGDTTALSKFERHRTQDRSVRNRRLAGLAGEEEDATAFGLLHAFGGGSDGIR